MGAPCHGSLGIWPLILRGPRLGTVEDLSRRRFFGFLAAAAAGIVAATSSTAQARQRTKVVWTEIDLPAGERQDAREKHLRKVLSKEARRVQWGEPDGGLVEASVKVTEFNVQRRPDVVRVSCTAVARLRNGPKVRTNFSFGGHPNRAQQLEEQMLLLVGRGLVTRLSSISRDRTKRRAASE